MSSHALSALAGSPIPCNHSCALVHLTLVPPSARRNAVQARTRTHHGGSPGCSATTSRWRCAASGAGRSFQAKPTTHFCARNPALSLLPRP
jgi:hypothetical protein